MDSSSIPMFTAFLLGLMTAISPCPLATNITALAYISKDIENRRRIFRNGLYYTLGRAITYTLIGLILYFGASKFHVSRAIQGNGERYLGPLLVVIGIWMLDVIKLNGSKGDLLQRFANKVNIGNAWGGLLLGMIFALAFCPYSGVLYFGMLIPMVMANTSGLLLLPIFAVSTGLPVVLLAYLLAFSLGSVSRFYTNVKIFERWFRQIVAVIFIITGIYFVMLFYC